MNPLAFKLLLYHFVDLRNVLINIVVFIIVVLWTHWLIKCRLEVRTFYLMEWLWDLLDIKSLLGHALLLLLHPLLRGIFLNLFWAFGNDFLYWFSLLNFTHFFALALAIFLVNNLSFQLYDLLRIFHVPLIDFIKNFRLNRTRLSSDFAFFWPWLYQSFFFRLRLNDLSWNGGPA